MTLNLSDEVSRQITGGASYDDDIPMRDPIILTTTVRPGVTPPVRQKENVPFGVTQIP